MRWPRAGVFTGPARLMRWAARWPFGYVARWSSPAWYVATDYRGVTLGCGRFTFGLGGIFGWGWEFVRG